MRIQKYDFACLKSCRSFRLGNKELWTLTVRLKDLPRTFTYGPNARFASLDKKPAKEMLATLASDPEAFVLNNNGIMLVAESLRAESDSVELVCHEAETDEEMPGHGILNGGHTYKALQEALANPSEYPRAADEAVVVVTVGLGIGKDDREEISRISKARNTSEKVPLHALRELNGDWSDLKRYLPEEARPLVAFKPGENPEAEFDVTDVVRRLALFNNRLFPAQESAHPVAAYTSIGSLVKKYDQKHFFDVAPLLPDILRLEELVVQYYESSSGQKARDQAKLGVITKLSGNSPQPMTLLSGYRSSMTLADPYVLPVVAAFRVFVLDGAWKADMATLWDKYGARVVGALLDAYKEQGKSSAAVFGRSKGSWAAACELTKAVAIQEGFIRIG